MTKYIDNGIHYGYKVVSYEALRHFATVVRKAYVARTRHSKPMLRPIGFVHLGHFPTKQDAVWAAKEWLKMRFGGGK